MTIFLVKRAMKHDTDAFIELINQNKQQLYKIAKSYLHSDHDIADVLQDTILACFENIHTLREPKYFKTWLIRILINQCKDFLKKNKDYCSLDKLPEPSIPDMTQNHLEFEELLMSVDEKYRIILILYYVEGFKIREIAQILDMNENTVKTRLSRAREACLKHSNLLSYQKGECL